MSLVDASDDSCLFAECRGDGLGLVGVSGRGDVGGVGLPRTLDYTRRRRAYTRLRVTYP